MKSCNLNDWSYLVWSVHISRQVAYDIASVVYVQKILCCKLSSVSDVNSCSLLFSYISGHVSFCNLFLQLVEVGASFQFSVILCGLTLRAVSSNVNNRKNKIKKK